MRQAKKGYAALSGDEVIAYVLHTHAVEGMELTESERAEYISVSKSGGHKEAIVRILAEYREDGE